MNKLSDYAENVYSQFGEDGIIRKIFDEIGVSSKVCVEFGAWDGFYLSNTANLWSKGWKGILIESDAEKYRVLLENVKGYQCHCIHARVGYEGTNTLERLLAREGLHECIDLLSIDVDGDDYFIFSSLSTLRPRVIICEYNPTIPVHLDLVPDPGNYFGCSALSLVQLAQAKGYRLVAMTESNCVFVLDEYFARFSAYETSLQALAFDNHLTYLITGYSGDYILSRQPTYGCVERSRQHFTGNYYALSSSLDKPTEPFVPKRTFRMKWNRVVERLIAAFHA